LPQQEPAPRAGWRPTFEPAIGTSDAQLLARLGNDEVVNGPCFWDPTQGGRYVQSPQKAFGIPSRYRSIGIYLSVSRLGNCLQMDSPECLHTTAQLSSARRGTVSVQKTYFNPASTCGLQMRPHAGPRCPRRHHGCVSDRRTSYHRAPLLLSNAAPVFKRDGRHHCRIFIAIVAVVGLQACRAIRKVTLKTRKIHLRACNLRGPPRPSGDWLFNWPLHTPWSTWSDAEHH
jgi:hypothetical protein